MNVRLLTGGAAALAIGTILACGSDASSGGAPDASSTPVGSTAPDASSDGSSSSSDGGGDAGSSVVDVRGKATYFLFDQPLVGATVTIGAQTATTGADGSFAIDNVTRPYDLRIAYSLGGATLTYIAEGVTRSDPDVEVSSYTAATQHSANVTGTVAGVTLPLAANERVRVVTSAANGGTFGATPDATTGAFVLNGISWRADGSTSTMKNVYAVHYTVDGAGTVQAIDRVVKATVAIDEGTTTNAGTLTLVAPAANSATMTIAPPSPALTGGVAKLGMMFEPACAVELPLGTDLSATLPIAFPASVSGITTYAFASGSFTGGGYAFAVKWPLVAGSTFTVDTGAPLSLTPAAGATFTPATSFAWSASATGPYIFSASDASNRPVMTIVTRAASVAWPADALPTSGAYSWRVSHQYDGQATVDDVLGGHGLSALVSRDAAPSRGFTVP